MGEVGSCHFYVGISNNDTDVGVDRLIEVVVCIRETFYFRFLCKLGSLSLLPSTLSLSFKDHFHFHLSLCLVAERLTFNLHFSLCQVAVRQLKCDFTLGITLAI